MPALRAWIANVYLARQQYAREAAIDLATGKGRLIAEHQHIEGIAILCARARKEAEVKGKDHTLGHDFGELEAAALLIQLILVD